jgi:hypothetical protein
MYMRMRDELGGMNQDGLFQELFARKCQPAELPGRLTWITTFGACFSLVVARLI